MTTRGEGTAFARVGGGRWMSQGSAESERGVRMSREGDRHDSLHRVAVAVCQD